MLRFLTAGESHGKAVVMILEGLPADIPIDEAAFQLALSQRQKGPGRGPRMEIEADSGQFLSGIRNGRTLGSPISIMIPNKDHKNWQGIMDIFPDSTCENKVTIPRPGHGDLAGALKYDFTDLRNVIERASARETAGRVAAGELCRQFLAHLGLGIESRIISLCGEKNAQLYESAPETGKIDDQIGNENSADSLSENCQDAIKKARESGDSCGAEIEIVALNVPVGLGSYSQRDRRLDGILAGAFFSIPTIKAVSFGEGLEGAGKKGSQFHDPIIVQDGTIKRSSNNAGGIEGGISNGMPIVARLYSKPLPTLIKGLPSVDLKDGKATVARYERSDISIAQALLVVAKCELAFVLADEILKKFGGDSLLEIGERVALWRKKIDDRLTVGTVKNFENSAGKSDENSAGKSDEKSFENSIAKSGESPVFLVGFMGVGKSTVGKKLAALIKWDFLEVDQLIFERYGRLPWEIIENFGEGYFRLLERTIIRDLMGRKRAIIATGGGAFCDNTNARLMLENGLVIWLCAGETEIEKRLLWDKERRYRPLFDENWKKLMKKREKFYSFAHLRVEVDGRKPDEIANEIFEHLKRLERNFPFFWKNKMSK